jgi:uncharacterized membrane protein YeiH
MGVITASFGGILRDLLGQEPSIVLRKDIYVSASAAGAALFLAALWAGVPREMAMAAGLVTAATIRGLAIWGNWALPVYRPRRGREPDEKGGVK